MEKWNKICYYLSENIQTDLLETQFEPKVEKALEILGWEEYSGDFEIRPKYQLGSTKDSLKPDFVLKSNISGEKLFVIEIKRPKTPLTKQNQTQLSTYMRQFKLDIGLLIGPKIQVFYDGELNKNENAILIKDIEFERNSKKGEEFIELFSKSNFNKKSLKEFAKKMVYTINQNEISRKLKQKIISEDFKNEIYELIINQLSTEFNKDKVISVLNDMKFEFSEKLSVTGYNKSINENSKSYKTNDDFEIVLTPSDQDIFKARLLVIKSATMKYFHKNGEIIEKHWDATNFTSRSNLMGNIYSKSGIRKKERIEQGIIKVEIEINE